MRYKTEFIDGHELRYSADWIHEIESKEHWMYYWNQAKLVRSLLSKNDKILEIGVGSGFLLNYLRNLEYNIISLDIDADKKPDLVGEVSSFNYSLLDVTVVLAFEIFEHIPLPLFKKALTALNTKNVEKILFSVPSCQTCLVTLSFNLPKIKKKKFSLVISRNKINTEAHHWELSSKRSAKKDAITLSNGKTLIQENLLTSIVGDAGFSLKKIDQIAQINFFLATKY